MSKHFKYLRSQFNDHPLQPKMKNDGKPLYKYSMYLQSRDNTWINRNTREDDEIIREDEEIHD